ncbi:periplasmic heavy metal sensor [bacterium]|nr:periplasmic heavy metal sensor [bacterium]
MKNKLSLILLIVSLCLNAGALVTFGFLVLRKEPAEASGDFRRCRQGLNKAELDQVDSLERNVFEKSNPIRMQLYQKRQELLALLKEPVLDTLKRNSLIKEIAELQVRLETISFDHLSDLKAALPAENREKFIQFVEECFCSNSDSCCPGESGNNCQHKEK